LLLENAAVKKAEDAYDRANTLTTTAEDRAFKVAGRDAMAQADLSGMSEANQKIFGPIVPFMDPNTVAQYLDADEESVDMMTGDIKNAMFIAKSMNPEGTQADWDQATAKILEVGNRPPVTNVNTMNSPGRKGNEDYSNEIMKTAESSRVTKGLLEQFAAASPGVQTGYIGDLVQKGASGMRQVAELVGLGDTIGMERIDEMLQTDSTGGAVLQAIGSRLALEMTNQLAGQISEKELAFAINAMPGLLNTPEGNKALVAMLGAKAQQDMDRVAFVEGQRGLNSDGMPSDKAAQLPGNIKKQVLAWDKANRLQVRDENGAITPYGKALQLAGMSITNDENWVPGDGVAPPDAPPDDDPGWK
jgi:hypothetical protein